MNEQKYVTTPQDIGVSQLNAAAWNVHAPSKKDDPAYRGLIESIRANGMLHRIVVRVASDPTADGYEVIDGHRRLEAAIALGWDEVPCEIVSGLDDAEAQAMTATANLQRLENDPLLEAALIARLADAGRTYGQIAAVIGKDTRYVARRARLCNLTAKWRDWFGAKAPDAADTMETVAAHEQPLQDEVFDELDIGSDEGEISDEEIEVCFTRHLRRIDVETPFDTAECAACPYNTATHGWLFPPEDDDCSGRCEKAACFTAKWNAATDAAIGRLRKRRVEVKEAKQKWDVPNYWNATKGKTHRNTQPWVYTEDGLKRLVWVEPKQEPSHAAPAMTEEEKAEAKRQKRIARARRSAYDKVRAVAKDNAETVVAALVDNGGWLTKRKDELMEQLTCYAADTTIAEILDFVNAKELDALGLELTEDEAEAVMTTDDNGEEA